ncbi:hypothetical protein NSU_0163 [Novosphingobium pentaromativorans US6-1]|uniref:NAD-dependent epimerase/dehydratase domain-containing protein n=1 Tax=Novosphingobium pentaromativorans US6-1 TaxID=1088721 RepID=G6E742_9SPHN|nr:hypothetical protein NSU_0163 [Novosphingobium pentaromativorans US6-1]
MLTGAFGEVGGWLIGELIGQGFRVTCFDIPSDASRQKEQVLRKTHAFDTVWGDLTREEDVRALIGKVRPDVVVHAAAIIPPATFRLPDLAEAVNVGGTRALIEACKSEVPRARFVLVSSYSVHGPSNPHRNPAPWDGATPLNPQDDYARQKVEAEGIVRASGLEHVIVRLCAVFPIERGGFNPDVLRFTFLLPYNRREHAVDVRDAALAIAKAASVPEAAGGTFDIGGGEGWSGIGGEMLNRLNESFGLAPLPREAFRAPDPESDQSWYYENWVDTAASEQVLRYQRTSFAEFLKERRRRAGFSKYVIALMRGRIKRKLLKLSPFYEPRAGVDSASFEQAAKRVLGPDAPRQDDR